MGAGAATGLAIAGEEDATAGGEDGRAVWPLRLVIGVLVIVGPQGGRIDAEFSGGGGRLRARRSSSQE